MALKDDLNSEVGKIVKSTWTERAGTVVPDDNSIGLGNDASRIEATVLYADLADSTILVDTYDPAFAAEVYKAFLHCAAKLIRENGGKITAYDGDRVMAVYVGTGKNSAAARTALRLKFAVEKIIQPALMAQYPLIGYRLKHVVGIDTSELFVAKTGIRGSNDLVWVGRAANHAAKLSALSDCYQTYVSEAVFKKLNSEVKNAPNGQSMWESARWTEFDGRIIFRSDWSYAID
jgi:class 3 adenylate cyclase